MFGHKARKANREEYEARVRGLMKLAEMQEQVNQLQAEQNQRFAAAIDTLERRIDDEGVARAANVQLTNTRIDGIIRRTPTPPTVHGGPPASAPTSPGNDVQGAGAGDPLPAPPFPADEWATRNATPAEAAS